MRENLFIRILKMEKKKPDIIENNVIEKISIFPKHNMSGIIPEEYCIEVITTIPERKNIIETLEI